MGRKEVEAKYRELAEAGTFDLGNWTYVVDGKVRLEALEKIATRHYGLIEAGEVRLVAPEDLYHWCEVGVARDPDGVFETNPELAERRRLVAEGKLDKTALGVFVLNPKRVKVRLRRPEIVEDGDDG